MYTYLCSQELVVVHNQKPATLAPIWMQPWDTLVAHLSQPDTRSRMRIWWIAYPSLLVDPTPYPLPYARTSREPIEAVLWGLTHRQECREIPLTVWWKSYDISYMHTVPLLSSCVAPAGKDLRNPERNSSFSGCFLLKILKITRLVLHEQALMDLAGLVCYAYHLKNWIDVR